LSVPAINYTLDITDAGNTTKIFKYTAPLSAFPDSALTVLASGFVDPSANQNGEAFALIAVTASGNAIPLPVVTGIETVEPGVAKSYSLEQNYPNPFNPSTTIAFALPESQKISLKIFDITGKEIATLISGDRPAGSYQITFDASNLASGIYFYQLNAGSFSATKRMMLIK
ncbi:MAG: T9SS type A sorting domain-containing protein, partial [Calditrichaeota bacterium]|nr:T9SS type A sorting domain-containing protein [Calditrichota bacterium]